jgi:hypothetical protein
MARILTSWENRAVMTVTVSGFLVGRTATQIDDQPACYPGNGATTVRYYGSALALIEAGT